MQTRQNVEKMSKCGDFLSGARGNAKLMINFFLPYYRKMIRSLEKITQALTSSFKLAFLSVEKWCFRDFSP